MPNPNPAREREADQFALVILMPPKLVKQWERVHGFVAAGDDEQLRKFANDFLVPLSDAAIRLEQLHRTTKKCRPR